ncbi:MAG: hypothetical protein IJH99_04535 [Eubacterium sp.]|nr:hypothetical protein [Eubacterium sp.]
MQNIGRQLKGKKGRFIIGACLAGLFAVLLTVFLFPSSATAETTAGEQVLAILEQKELSEAQQDIELAKQQRAEVQAAAAEAAEAEEAARIQAEADAAAAVEAEEAARAQAAAEREAARQEAYETALANAASELEAESIRVAARFPEEAYACPAEDIPSLPELALIDFKELYADSLVMGDSNAYGLVELDMLYSTSIRADVGVCLPDAEADYAIEVAASLSPKNIFLYYGHNDVINYIGCEEYFYAQYYDFVVRLKAACPNAKIYVNALFPCLSAYYDIYDCYRDLTVHNQLIEQMCRELNVVYMDNNDLIRTEYYCEDGYHMNYPFYLCWLYRMAETAGML